MDYREPTPAEIEEARAYIRQRIESQHELDSHLAELFDEAAQKIAAIIMRYKRLELGLRFRGNGRMAREITEVLDWLQEEIDRWTLYYAIPDEAKQDEGDDLLIFDAIHEEDHGYTYDQREELYKNNFLMRLAAYDEWGALDDEQDLIAAIEESTSSVEGRWKLLAENSVAIGFAALALNNAKSGSAIGFINYPGSSAPCPMCVERFGKFFPITDSGNHPPLHPHCCCIPVYIYL